MDKESEERMAPALHSADHEAASPLLTNTKYSSCSPPSSISQPEADDFTQYNGVLSSSATNNMACDGKMDQYPSPLKFESHSISFRIGSSGDFNSILPNLRGSSSKTSSSQHNLECGDAVSHCINQNDPLKEDKNLNLSAKLPATPAVGDLLYLGDQKSKAFDNTSPIFSSVSNATERQDDKFLPSLLVNVDKHDSINAQIIHTTSITTSPLATTNLLQKSVSNDINFKSKNDRTTNNHHHKNNLKTFASVCKGSNILNESLQNELNSMNPDIYEHEGSCTHKENGDKAISLSKEARLIEENLHDVDSVTLLSFSTLVSRSSSTFSSCSLDSSIITCSSFLTDKTIVKFTPVDTSNSQLSDDNNKVNVIDASFHSESANTCEKAGTNITISSSNNVHISTNNSTECSVLLSTNKTVHSNISHDSFSSNHVSLSSVTQTTPVYNCQDSISAYRIQSESGIESSDSTARKSETNDKLSLQNVDDLQHLAHDIVTGKHMQQLPTNVTNTLQQLAASLIEDHQNKVSERTKASNDLATSSKNVPSKDSSYIQYIMSHLTDFEKRHKCQYSETAKCKAKLDDRLSKLRFRVNYLRSAAVIRHCKKHLPLWKSSKNLYAKSRFGEDDTSSIDAMQSHSVHHKTDGNKKAGPENADCIVDSLSSKFQRDLSAPSTQLGVLKKELRSARRKIDPDLTESSSDEDSDEIAALQKSISLSQPIDKTPLWKWVHDRVAIAHKWTWLEAQVTGLEYKIKQHLELQQQLRAAKGEVKLGYQIVENSCTDTDDQIKDHQPELSASHSNSVTSSSAISQPTIESCDQSQLTCARVRPLQNRLRHRQIVRVSDIAQVEKKLKPPAVHHDSDIMRPDLPRHTPYHRADGKSRGVVLASMRNRAAMHDHSYHKILSSPEDLPVSARVNAFLLTNNKQFAAKLRRAERRFNKRNKRKQQLKHDEDRLVEKIKPRPRSATVVLERADKLIRSVSSLQRNTSYEDRTSYSELKKRRSTTTSFFDANKRSRVTSIDSDAESYHHRGESGTPVFDSSANHNNNPQYQAVLKRKRANDQAYDINNIVIPHGLTAARIEKLQYKEILTPGWRTTSPESVSTGSASDEDQEDVSDEMFQSRHDRHEILEKKKYMNFLEMNMNKRSGSRSMSRANLPLDDPASFFSSSYRSSPSNPISPTDFSSPASPEIIKPTVALRSRRSSSEHSVHSNASTQPLERSRLHDSLSSSDGIHRMNWDTSTSECWERRVFPLAQQELDEMKKDPVVFLKKLPKEVESGGIFHPISGHSGGHESPLVAKQRHTASKRSRNNSHASVASRDDERHSDDSVSSLRSLHRVRSFASDRAVPSPPPPPAVYSQRKRHKPTTLKEDFYYYSEIESSSEGGSDTDSDENIPTSSGRPESRWESRRVSSSSTPRLSPSGDDERQGSPKPPLLLKVKKKFLFR